MDSTTTVETLKAKIKTFNEERDWDRYHSPKNLSMAVAVEAAELMEIFTWQGSEESTQVLEQRRQEVENEIADVAYALLSFCSLYGIDLSKAMEHKMVLNAKKYPLKDENNH